MKKTEATVCPVCQSPVETSPEVHCPVCDYRSSDAIEYLWTFLAGIVFVFTGFAFGAIALLTEGRPSTHWRGVFSDWFPIAPWPDSYHWLAFLVVGIILTMGGLGLTRRRPAGWLSLLLLTIYETALAGGALLGLWGKVETPTAPSCVAIGSLLAAALLARVGIAFRRLPQRDAETLQRRAQQRRDEVGTAPRPTEPRDQSP